MTLTPQPDPVATSKFSTVYTILSALVVVMAALTWIISAGEYQRAPNAALGQDVPVPNTYSQVDPAPQSILDVLMAPSQAFMTRHLTPRPRSTCRCSFCSLANSWAS
jgi:uncharacterized ion transporter superfamily protein YfcC